MNHFQFESFNEKISIAVATPDIPTCSFAPRSTIKPLRLHSMIDSRVNCAIAGAMVVRDDGKRSTIKLEMSICGCA